MPKSNSKVQKKRTEKIPVTFNEQQLELIESVGGLMGNTKAEIIRNITINWLLEREKREKAGGQDETS